MVGPDGPATRAIVGALGRRGYEVTRRDDPAELPARSADTFALVILVDVGWDEQPSFAHVKQYARLLSRGGSALLVVTHDDTVDDLAALVAAGARDFLVWPRDKAALKARILALESMQRAMAAAQDARDQMDAVLRAFTDTHVVLEHDGVITEVARGPSGGDDESDGVVGWIGRRIDEVFSAPAGRELLDGVQRATETGEVVALGAAVSVKGQRWLARLSPLAHGRVLCILRPEHEARAGLAQGTEPPRRLVADGRAVAATPPSDGIDEPAPRAGDVPPRRPPARSR